MNAIRASLGYTPVCLFAKGKEEEIRTLGGRKANLLVKRSGVNFFERTHFFGSCAIGCIGGDFLLTAIVPNNQTQSKDNIRPLYFCPIHCYSLDSSKSC